MFPGHCFSAYVRVYRSSVDVHSTRGWTLGARSWSLPLRFSQGVAWYFPTNFVFSDLRGFAVLADSKCFADRAECSIFPRFFGRFLCVRPSRIKFGGSQLESSPENFAGRCVVSCHQLCCVGPPRFRYLGTWPPLVLQWFVLSFVWYHGNFLPWNTVT